jgi:hypothetical protein
MNNRLYAGASLFLIVAIGSFLARHFGWYNDYFFTDIILHTISGIALGFLWAGMYMRVEQPRRLLALGMVGFATFGSVLWEFWEYAGYLITRSSVPFYIPQL